MYVLVGSFMKYWRSFRQREQTVMTELQRAWHKSSFQKRFAGTRVVKS